MNAKLILLAFVLTQGTLQSEPHAPSLSSRESLSLTLRRSNSELSSLAHGQGRYIAVGQTGLILSSPDGRNWIHEDSGTTASLRSVVFGQRLFVAVGNLGTILTSPNGQRWTLRGSKDYPCLASVVHAKGLFVAVGENGGIFTSPDGVKWSRRESGTSARLRSVGFGAKRFIAVGTGGGHPQFERWGALESTLLGNHTGLEKRVL
ncbi:MAG: hypothetical protein AB1813_10200 [Verrucomicrobiota bacterium]